MFLDLSPLWISLKVSIIATIITFFLGVSIAYQFYLIKTQFFKSKFLNLLTLIVENILLIPVILPPTVIGFILLIILGKNGFLGKILAFYNFSFIFTWYGAVITGIVVSFPLMFRISLSSFAQINPFILDVARLEGIREIFIFFYIAFPLVIRGILSAIILSFTRILGEFGATLIIAGNIPRQTQTIPMAIYFAIQAGEFQQAWFWVMIVLLISLLGLFLLNYLSFSIGDREAHISIK